jgi:hypothetical protein
MAERQPIAFLSYVRSDDDHDDGRITAFRKRLEGEVRMQTGKPFAIFQDRNDIAWGQHWEDRINSSLLDVTFLIPVLTPSFFQSPACRSEFQTFSLKEKMLGANRLILPLYYVVCDHLGEPPLNMPVRTPLHSYQLQKVGRPCTRDKATQAMLPDCTLRSKVLGRLASLLLNRTVNNSQK